MPITEPIPAQTRPPITANPSGWKRTAIIVLITAVVSAAGGYLVGLRTTQNPLGKQETSLLTSISPTTTPASTFFVGSSVGKTSTSPATTPLPTAPPLPTLFVSNTFYPVPTTDPTLTADWKTYKSDKYGFSFHYPRIYILNSIPCQKGYVCHLEWLTINTQPIPPHLDIYDFMTYDGQSYILGSLQLLVTFEPYDKMYESWVGSGATYESIGIGGKIGHIIWKDDTFQERRYRRLIITTSLKEKNNKMVYIHALYSDNGKTTIPMDEFNQILSTFTFSDRH